jgi:hypothetical protein
MLFDSGLAHKKTVADGNPPATANDLSFEGFVKTSRRMVAATATRRQPSRRYHLVGLYRNNSQNTSFQDNFPYQNRSR